MNKKLLLEFRAKKDKHWREDDESPLTEEQKKKFRGLNYFPPNADLYFELPLLTDIPDLGKEVVIKTTGGDEQIYKRAGKIRFIFEDKEIETIVFEDPEIEQVQYYLLFKDLTSGKETYENGRMLQIEKKEDILVVDFNSSYNPYSSYNDNWDCPIVPKENTINIPIKAGEKIFS